MKLKIKVTKEILERSKFCGTEETIKNLIDHIQTNCAVALAVREIFPKCYVKTYTITEHFVKEMSAWEIPLPEEVSSFIEAFDSLEPEQRVQMTPFEFEIPIPQEVIDSISIEGIKELIKDSKTLELV